MTFKRKMKIRFFMYLAFLMLGCVMMALGYFSGGESGYISPFGLGMFTVGLVKIRNYRIITRDEETLRKYEIAEGDERNIAIITKSRSYAFSAYVLLSAVGVIILTLLGKETAAAWVSSSLCLLLILNLGFYRWVRKNS